MISTSFRVSPRYELVISLMISEIERTRTSGLLVFVGLGSYFAYRLCVKYFGANFLSSLLFGNLSTPVQTIKAEKLLENQPYQVKDCYDIYADDEWSSDEEEIDSASLDTCTTFLPRNEQLKSPRKSSLTPCLISSGSAGFCSPYRDARFSPPSRNSTPLKKHSCRMSPPFNDSAISPRRRSLPQSPQCAKGQRQNKLKHERNIPQQHITVAHKNQDDFRSSGTSSDDYAVDSPPPIRRKRPQSLLKLPENGAATGQDSISLVSSCPSSASAGLQFSWDAVCTPAEIDENLQQILLLGNSDTDPETLAQRVLRNLPQFIRDNSKSPAPSELSCMSEVSAGGIQKIGLEAAESLERLETDISQLKNGLENLKGDVSDLLTRSHCTEDSKYLYRSVIVAPSDLGSDIGSVRSLEIPWFSRENLRNYPHSQESADNYNPSRRSSAAGDFNRADKSSPACNTGESVDRSFMESGVLDDSYHSHICMDFTPSSEGGVTTKSDKSSDTRKSQQRLFDSAICTDDFASSDSNSDSGYLPKSSKNFEISLGITPEEPNNFDIFEIVEDSRCSSLEWDEMRLRSAAESGSLVGSGSIRTDTGIEESMTDLWTAKIPQRDVMVFARENYGANLDVMKVLHQLYKRRRLRRTMDLRPSFYAPVQACLFSVLQQGLSIFKCNTFDVVSEAVDLSLKRCFFLNKWTLPKEVRESIGFVNRNSEDEAVKCAMESCLKHLWDLDPSSAQQITSDKQGPVLLEAMKLLMVLKSLEVYDHTLSFRHPFRPFYAELFLTKSPKDIMEDLSSAGWTRSFTELEIALMAESLGLRLEIFKLSTSRPNVAAVYPDKTVTLPSVTLLEIDPESSIYMPLFHCGEV